MYGVYSPRLIPQKSTIHVGKYTTHGSSFVVKNSGWSLREEIKLAVEGQATSIPELRQREAQKELDLPLLGGCCLDDHPSGCKWLITMVIVFVP